MSDKASWQHWAGEVAKVRHHAEALGGTHDNTPEDQEAERLLTAACEALEALESHARQCASPENAFDRFERLAAEFHAETGYLAPGKDRAFPDDISREELRAKWENWLAEPRT